jgi:hypothetical protein
MKKMKKRNKKYTPKTFCPSHFLEQNPHQCKAEVDRRRKQDIHLVLTIGLEPYLTSLPATTYNGEVLTNANNVEREYWQRILKET